MNMCAWACSRPHRRCHYDLRSKLIVWCTCKKSVVSQAHQINLIAWGVILGIENPIQPKPCSKLTIFLLRMCTLYLRAHSVDGWLHLCLSLVHFYFWIFLDLRRRCCCCYLFSIYHKWLNERHSDVIVLIWLFRLFIIIISPTITLDRLKFNNGNSAILFNYNKSVMWIIIQWY